MSHELLNKLTLFSQYAAVSYCDQNINATGRALTCDHGTCPLVEAADTVTIDTFQQQGHDE